jgi:hypothetical protein
VIGLDAALHAVESEIAYAQQQLSQTYSRVVELERTLAQLRDLAKAPAVELVHSAAATPVGSDPVVPPQAPTPPAPQHIPTSSPPQEPLRVVEPVEVDEDEDPGVSHYECHCGRQFPTRHGLVMHKTRSHKFDPDLARIRAAEAFS